MKLVCALLICSVCKLGAQPAFDVASVKASNSGAAGNSAATVASGATASSGVTHGGFHVRHTNLKALICTAYQVLYFQISGAPNWMDSEAFDIDAKSEKPASPAETRQMLQTLLVERFHLKLRRDSKEMTVLALSVANGKTLKLTPADQSACQDDPFAPSNPCGHLSMGAGSVLIGDRMSMPVFSKVLGSNFGETIVDKTNLDGVYSFQLDLARAGFRPGSTMDAIGAVMAALPDQLGLKLDRTKGATEMLVIEHVERPSED